jgi:hypothetical protein
MSLTPYLSQDLYSGTSTPTVPPADQAYPAQYVQFDANNASVVSVFEWNPTSLMWIVIPHQSAANRTFIDPCGWYGPHSASRRPAPVHSLFPAAGSWTPVFSVSVASSSPIPFELIDLDSGSTIASGTFPALANVATAAQVSLVDSTNLPVVAFTLAGNTRVVCVPTGGHASMPSDGETFQVGGVVLL